MTTEQEVNPLECAVCGYVAGAPATFRIHMGTHPVIEEDKVTPESILFNKFDDLTVVGKFVEEPVKKPKVAKKK